MSKMKMEKPKTVVCYYIKSWRLSKTRGGRSREQAPVPPQAPFPTGLILKKNLWLVAVQATHKSRVTGTPSPTHCADGSQGPESCIKSHHAVRVCRS